MWFLLQLLALTCFAAAQTLYTRPCPLLNLNYPPLSSYASSPIIQSTICALNESFARILSEATIYGEIVPDADAFSIDIWSVHDEEPLFTYHYTPAELTAQRTVGVETVDSDTVYRIGSISKMLTVYVYLIAAGDETWNQPVTRFVTELATYAESNRALLQDSSIDIVDWDSITVGSLATHLSGISREEVYSPAFEQGLSQLFNLPPSTRNESAACGDDQVIKIPCDRTAFFQDFLRQHPVTAPFTTPIYSNIAFQILGYAIENITGTSMSDLFDSSLVERLRLNNTYYSVPPSPDNSIIPINATASLWDFDARDETPTGGNYASVNDLRKIGISILNYTLTTGALTRRWLKPYTFTTNTDFAVGAPWEILRAPGDPVSWIYSKTGSFGAYAGIVALLPEYNVGFTVLAAGSSTVNTVRILSDIIADNLYPAVYNASKAAIAAEYTGTYANSDTNSSITISIPDSGPGLFISDWTFNGTEAIPLLTNVFGLNQTTQTLNVTIYPSGLSNRNRTITSWRAVFRTSPQTLDPGIFSENCVSWATVNTLSYDGIGFDEFLFTLNESGTVMAVEPRIFESDLLSSSGYVLPRMLQKLI